MVARRRSFSYLFRPTTRRSFIFSSEQPLSSHAQKNRRRQLEDEYDAVGVRRFRRAPLLEIGDLDEVEVVIVPPFTAIAKVMEALGAAQNIKVGAQNMHWER